MPSKNKLQFELNAPLSYYKWDKYDLTEQDAYSWEQYGLSTGWETFSPKDETIYHTTKMNRITYGMHWAFPAHVGGSTIINDSPIYADRYGMQFYTKTDCTYTFETYKRLIPYIDVDAALESLYIDYPNDEIKDVPVMSLQLMNNWMYMDVAVEGSNGIPKTNDFTSQTFQYGSRIDPVWPTHYSGTQLVSDTLGYMDSRLDQLAWDWGIVHLYLGHITDVLGNEFGYTPGEMCKNFGHLSQFLSEEHKGYTEHAGYVWGKKTDDGAPQSDEHPWYNLSGLARANCPVLFLPAPFEVILGDNTKVSGKYYLYMITPDSYYQDGKIYNVVGITPIYWNYSLCRSDRSLPWQVSNNITQLERMFYTQSVQEEYDITDTAWRTLSTSSKIATQIEEKSDTATEPEWGWSTYYYTGMREPTETYQVANLNDFLDFDSDFDWDAHPNNGIQEDEGVNKFFIGQTEYFPYLWNVYRWKTAKYELQKMYYRSYAYSAQTPVKNVYLAARDSVIKNLGYYNNEVGTRITDSEQINFSSNLPIHSFELCKFATGLLDVYDDDDRTLKVLQPNEQGGMILGDGTYNRVGICPFQYNQTNINKAQYIDQLNTTQLNLDYVPLKPDYYGDSSVTTKGIGYFGDYRGYETPVGLLYNFSNYYAQGYRFASIKRRTNDGQQSVKYYAILPETSLIVNDSGWFISNTMEIGIVEKTASTTNRAMFESYYTSIRNVTASNYPTDPMFARVEQVVLLSGGTWPNFSYVTTLEESTIIPQPDLNSAPDTRDIIWYPTGRMIYDESEYLYDIGSLRQTDYTEGKNGHYCYIYAGLNPDHTTGEKVYQRDVVSLDRNAYPDDGPLETHYYIYKGFGLMWYKHNKVGEVTAFTTSAYPNDNQQMGYWYVRTEEHINETEFTITDEFIEGDVTYRMTGNDSSEDIHFGSIGSAEIEFNLAYGDILGPLILDRQCRYETLKPDGTYRQVGIFYNRSVEYPKTTKAAIRCQDALYRVLESEATYTTLGGAGEELTAVIMKLEAALSTGGIIGTTGAYITRTTGLGINPTVNKFQFETEDTHPLYADMLRWIAEVNAATVFCDSLGRINISLINQHPQAEAIRNDQYVEFNKQPYAPSKAHQLAINTHTATLFYNDGYADYSKSTYWIKDNPLTYYWTQTGYYGTYGLALFDLINAIEYIPCSIKFVTRPECAYTPMDLWPVEWEGQTYNLCTMDITIDGSGTTINSYAPRLRLLRQP